MWSPAAVAHLLQGSSCWVPWLVIGVTAACLASQTVCTFSSDLIFIHTTAAQGRASLLGVVSVETLEMVLGENPSRSAGSEGLSPPGTKTQATFKVPSVPILMLAWT